MCLILFAHDLHPHFRLVLAANRDEFHARPTAPAGRWSDGPHVVGGRDLEAGGSWLGVTSQGRWAAVTNFREGAEAVRVARSRGRLVQDYLIGGDPPEQYVRMVVDAGNSYNGFNLLVGEGPDLFWASNRSSEAAPYRRLEPGVYGVSNHLLDTPWPKLVQGKWRLSAVLASADPPAPRPLLDLLMDRTVALDHDLPSTGIATKLERALSAAFIATPGYGTRSSSALLIDRADGILFAERRFDEAGRTVDETVIEV